MDDISKMKCAVCKCHDNFDGCTAFDCQYDFEISAQKLREAARDYGIPAGQIVASIMAMDKTNRENNASNELPDDFNPETDTQFLISFANALDLGKNRLIDMETEDLKRLLAEINFVLEARNNDAIN